MKLRPKDENYQPNFRIKKNLNLTSLIAKVSRQFNLVPDQRRQSHCVYKQHDVMMAALSCMFLQQPSWLQFQQQLQAGLNDNNMAHLFNTTELPKETQTREILDDIDSENYRSTFKTLFEQVRQDKQLDIFRLPLTLEGIFYVAVDGSQYHSSKEIHCEHCLTKVHKGVTTYQHQVLQGAVMHPDCRQVIPLMPEPILNTDGHKKQDCEHRATLRFLTKLREDHPRLPLLIGGDGLFSDSTITKHVLSLNMHYIFTCKPGDHTYLTQWLEAYTDGWPWSEHIEDKKRKHCYRWRNKVPLSGQKNAPDVNFLEYEEINIETGKVVYRNSWVTDLEITASNVWRLIRTGRCRWKIENECFNSLKNQGYEMKHNYGHGKNFLSHNMYLSTLLAFFLHQILELCDEAYQQCRKAFGSKRNLWERIRQVTCMFIIPDWYWLFAWCLDPKNKEFTLDDS
jgi:hypothetical protein